MGGFTFVNSLSLICLEESEFDDADGVINALRSRVYNRAYLAPSVTYVVIYSFARIMAHYRMIAIARVGGSSFATMKSLIRVDDELIVFDDATPR